MVTCSPPSRQPQRPTATNAPPADVYVPPFTILYDTREQAPWTFANIVIEKRLWVAPRKLTTLNPGDYSIEGMERLLCVERKSSADFVGSVTAGAGRFKREHERMAELVAAGAFACVVIEGCLAAMCDELEAEAGRRVTPEMLLGVTASWPARYGVHWFFAGDRRRAELLAFRLMVKRWVEWGSAGTENKNK